jgi:hypothetical protein
MGDKNLEQRINIKFCMKVGEIDSEALALLILAYGGIRCEEIESF